MKVSSNKSKILGRTWEEYRDITSKNIESWNYKKEDRKSYRHAKASYR